MTPTHDTAAALWSAIDAYGCDAASHGALGKDATTRAAIDRAITAHVEAEVARRLEAAPGVEAAIDNLRRVDRQSRRLLDEYDRATRHSYVTGGPERLRAARAALLRALGVEA